ncbi:phosphoadenosine phosphosulfate reductase family protein [Roseovarius sp. MMSF_3350]|uniref:phosphoadenosine phosphosulfate reductase family protein n=1 Tax=Roseovarius sp. MMSF_3350 TaxID=3046706 RepID=UPI00273D6F42|nr:phosphoadenosine phosphosulfate reductase family protein [Roseovarius sp. MMSF_3350]
MTSTAHIINISGGKDSGACVELALLRGNPFRSVIADTGNESEITWEHVDRLSDHIRARIGGDGIEVYRADFTDRIARKRKFVADNWPNQGVPESDVQAALEILQPTGNPFLDLCIWKGRFPSRRAQFCTEFLKYEAIWQQCLMPTLQNQPVIQWIGVRRDESVARANAQSWRTMRSTGLHQLRYFQPLIHWTADNVFSFTRARNAPINPLYMKGMKRVGCFPCINASKNEIEQISRRYPEAIERIATWESIVKKASKRGAATFFASKTTPRGAAMARAGIKGGRNDADFPDAFEVAEWAKTDRTGRHRDWILEAEREDEGLCASQYGLCE